MKRIALAGAVFALVSPLHAQQQVKPPIAV